MKRIIIGLLLLSGNSYSAEKYVEAEILNFTMCAERVITTHVSEEKYRMLDWAETSTLLGGMTSTECDSEYKSFVETVADKPGHTEFVGGVLMAVAARQREMIMSYKDAHKSQ